MKRVLFAALCASLLAAPVRGQGVQTGTITGTITTSDGLSLPGATITASSPALQGMRTAVTDVNGVYFIRGLPAGSYSLSFEMPDMQPAKRDDVVVPVGGTVEINTTMSLGTRTESVTVTAELPSPLATITTSQAYTKKEVDALPVGRTPAQIAELAPGLTNNTPNVGQVAINGGFAYDNVFMINGVDVNDNLFGTSNNLFIEDAIQETNVLTSGISAEFGRFSGGVINVITKSGGNNFSGSFRDNLENPKWVENTPREDTNHVVHQDIFSKVYEGTFGGPLMLNRLWFFSAGRYQNSSTPQTFPQSGIAYTQQVTNKRGELKFTGTPAQNQTFQGSYTNNATTQANASGLSGSLLVDPKDLVTRQNPNSLFAINYNGVLATKFFASAQYSQKSQGFRNTGGTSTSIGDSPFRTRGVTSGVPVNLFYNAPYFDSTDPEDRNNKQITGSLAYTAASKRFGTHDLKGGAEYYISTRTGGNSQTSTGYVFRTDYLVAGGAPVLTGSSPIPVFTPGVSRLENWIPTRGAKIDIKTTSLYVQDHWVATPRVTFDLGTRFEAVRSNATGDIVTVDTTSLVPRLGATLDLEGNGRTVAQVTYAHYAGKYSEAQFARNTSVGNPSSITYLYTGPAGQGVDFAPGMNPANYTTIVGGSFPTANIFTDPNLRSPLTKEFTVGLGRDFGRGSFVKGTYVWRKWTHFVESFIDLADGVTTIQQLPTKPQFTNVVYRNTDVPTRDYQAIVLQTNHRLHDKFTVGAHYTLQIRNHGNFSGEAANQPAISTVYGDFPEILSPALDRYLPEGNLGDFQRHKLRVYGVYSQALGRFGALDISPIWRVNSATTYSLVANNVGLTPIELARNPGYPATDVSPASAYNLYFGSLGSQYFRGYGVVDLSATYSIPVWHSARPWVKIEIYNLLNNDKQIGWDTTVTPDRTSALDANGLPTGYIKGPRFGQPTNDNQFPQPYPGQNGIRLFRMAFGIRF